LHSFDADGADALKQIDDVIFVVGKALRVEFCGDRGAFVFLKSQL
jgi:hypothetical protein